MNMNGTHPDEQPNNDDGLHVSLSHIKDLKVIAYTVPGQAPELIEANDYVAQIGDVIDWIGEIAADPEQAEAAGVAIVTLKIARAMIVKALGL